VSAESDEKKSHTKFTMAHKNSVTVPRRKSDFFATTVPSLRR
jgi:hypothetical protein